MSNKRFTLQNFRAESAVVELDGYIAVTNADGYSIDSSSWTPFVTATFVSTGTYLLTIQPKFYRALGASIEIQSASTTLDLSHYVQFKNAAGNSAVLTPVSCTVRFRTAGTLTDVGQNNGFSYKLKFKNSQLKSGS